MGIYSETLELNDHWREYILNTKNYKYNWAEGAYRSSKSVSNTLAFAMHLERTPDMVHLVIASTVATARAIVEDGDGSLGLRQYFDKNYIQTKYKGYDAGKIKTSTGTKIVVYLGGAMESSYKCFRGWSLGSIVLEEINLLHPNTITEAKGRTLMAKDPKYFISHNPVIKTHPIYKWLEELEEQGLVNYDHSTIYDNPAISEKRRNEIISEFPPNSIFYRQYILGERVSAEGAIYTVYDYNIINDFNPDDYFNYIIVCDQGESTSASVFGLAGLRYDKTTGKYSLDILKEYYYINNGKSNLQIKMYADTANDLAAFYKECCNLMHKHPSAVLIDQSPEFYRNVSNSFRSSGLNTALIYYVNKDEIEERIKRGVNLLYLNQLHFYKGCINTIEDIRNAEYDEDKIEKTGKFTRKKEYTSKGHLDAVDMVDYSFTWFKKYL